MERGSGETLACGTGACAVAVASTLNGLVDEDKPVTVKLLGGDLQILWNRQENLVYMTGSATTVFDGEIFYKKQGDFVSQSPCFFIKP